jgi:hypothetical protein
VASLIQHDPKSQEFTAELSGHRGALQYRYANRVMTIAHITVPPAIGGRGVAAELASAALHWARDQGWTVIPECSYARTFMARHAEYADLWSAQAPGRPSVESTDADASNRAHVDALLDEALDESFPASDPPAVGREQ